jgi:hypothetical protein
MDQSTLRTPAMLEVSTRSIAITIEREAERLGPFIAIYGPNIDLDNSSVINITTSSIAVSVDRLRRSSSTLQQCWKIQHAHENMATFWSP